MYSDTPNTSGSEKAFSPQYWSEHGFLLAPDTSKNDWKYVSYINEKFGYYDHEKDITLFANLRPVALSNKKKKEKD